MTGNANPAAAVRARLLNQAKADEAQFDLTLTQFALERLLYRLSLSPHRDRFLLKGALLFNLWFSERHRPTRDADFLGLGPSDPQSLEAVFREICCIRAEDGITFDSGSVKAREIRRAANYPGVRITLSGKLDGARCPVQADIGFGDVVTPAPEETDYPVILSDLPAPRLLVYPRYTAIAEKFEAITALGMANSRMKDFFDLWVLTRDGALDPAIVRTAVIATFARRGTSLAVDTSGGLSDEFALDSTKQTQWHAFITRSKLNAPPLPQVIAHLRNFLKGTLRVPGLDHE